MEGGGGGVGEKRVDGGGGVERYGRGRLKRCGRVGEGCVEDKHWRTKYLEVRMGIWKNVLHREVA